MGLQIKFDVNNLPIPPTFILAHRNGDVIGKLDNISNIHLGDSLNGTPEISFDIKKYKNGVICNVWFDIKDFKIVYCREWNMWFQVKVKYTEEEDILKSVILSRLAESELSQINVYGLEINTENDINRDDYNENTPTVIFNPVHPEISLLHRLFEKAPHYKIIHCDSSIANMVRTFSWDSKSIQECLNELSQELNCIVDYLTYNDEEGHIVRGISIYDLESNCLNEECNYYKENGRMYRGEFTDVCPHCGSSNITEGYGEDTTIFLSRDCLAENISLETTTESVKNCFRLFAGDDLMTATITNCMPNGSGYLWYFSDEFKNDMPVELVEKLNQYEQLLEYYNNQHITVLNEDNTEKYNNLIDKYKIFNSDLSYIPLNITGYLNLIKHYYATIDLSLYLQSSLMPNWEISDTNAILQAQQLQNKGIITVAVKDSSYISEATANSVILNYAKLLIDSRYKIKVNESMLDNNIWQGNFVITNYSNDEDTAITTDFIININDEYEQYVQQQVQVALKEYQESENPYDIETIFKKDYESFALELKKYSLDYLQIFYNACQSVINILIEQGVANENGWIETDSDLYNDLYIPYYNKLSLIENEIQVRENEIKVITGDYDSEGYIIQNGIQNYLDSAISTIQIILDLQNYLGNDLWLSFCSYIREDKYVNENYISDGLTNSELFDNAKEFIERASKDIIKSSNLQHKITANLKNLLVIKDFKKLVNYFKCGNWLRIKVENDIYKLRLLAYDMGFNDLSNINVEFSDVTFIKDGYTDIESILEKANSMATNYASISRQAIKGNKSAQQINDWINNGLSLTKSKIIDNADNQEQTWDSHGMLFKKYNPDIDNYDDSQVKIINKGIYFTNDNWRTAKVGLGNYTFYNPATKRTEEAYGLIADTIVGNIILAENVGIYNRNDSMTMDENGLIITSNSNDNNANLFTIRKKYTSSFKQAEIYVSMLKSISIISQDYDIDFTINSLSILNEYLEYISSLKIDEENIFIKDDNDNIIPNDSLSSKTGYTETVYIYNIIADKINNLTNGVEIDTDAFEDLLYIDDKGELVINGSIRINTGNETLDLKNYFQSEDMQEQLNNMIQEQVNLKSNSIADQYAEQMKNLEDTLNGYETAFGQYLSYTAEEGLRLGATSSDFYTLIDNQGMYFKNKNVKVAYINNTQLYIPNAVITTSLTLGNYFLSVRKSGGVSLVYGKNGLEV